MERDNNYYLNKLLELALNIANIVDREGEEGNTELGDRLGLGYRALSGHLRRGAKAVIDLQSDYSHAKEMEHYAKMGEQQATKFLVDIFGDDQIDTVNDETKEKIRAFVKNMNAEDEFNFMVQQCKEAISQCAISQNPRISCAYDLENIYIFYDQVCDENGEWDYEHCITLHQEENTSDNWLFAQKLALQLGSDLRIRVCVCKQPEREKNSNS